ncbi:hypothetical protein V1291_003967 [Nitrobacteraceae bacterium AZCC 1564]
MSVTRDFWLTSGHHLLDRDAEGRLRITSDFIKAYLARPELVPPGDACSAERELYRLLFEDPLRPVANSQISVIADADARENWSVLIEWRDHLASVDTLEAAYLDIVRRSLRFPHIFISQLVQAILRNMLNDCDDVFVLRAAEMFFRPQKFNLQEGTMLATDLETAEHHEGRRDSPLVALLGLPPTSGVDVLSDGNMSSYWSRSDMFDMALDFTGGQRGLTALGEVVARWISHLLAVDVVIEPLTELRDTPLVWYVGLDSDATRLGNSLWNNDEIDETAYSRILGLYRLTFTNPADVIERVRGEPVYLIIAIGEDEVLRLKPQNLVTGLPIAQVENVN